MKQLETERLFLRPFIKDDFIGLYDILKDQRNFKYTDTGKTYTLMETKNFLQYYLSPQKQEINIAISLKNTNHLIGIIVLKFDTISRAEISCILNYNYQNNGYMKEAFQAIIHYAFSIIKIVTLWADTIVDNQHSIKLLESCNFRLFETKKKHRYLNQNFYDVSYYILNNPFL